MKTFNQFLTEVLDQGVGGYLKAASANRNQHLRKMNDAIYATSHSAKGTRAEKIEAGREGVRAGRLVKRRSVGIELALDKKTKREFNY